MCYIDLRRYTILQSLKLVATGSGRANPTIFITYKFSYQQPIIQTSFDMMAPSESHNQVSCPFEIHLLNRSIHVILLVGRPDGYQPYSMATATEQC